MELKGVIYSNCRSLSSGTLQRFYESALWPQVSQAIYYYDISKNEGKTNRNYLEIEINYLTKGIAKLVK